MAEAKKTNYGNESISSLKGADRVRKRPGVIFGSEGRNYIRISLCCNEEMLQEALDRITTTRTKQNQ